MKKWIARLLIWVLILITLGNFVFKKRNRICGALSEPFIENVLSKVFQMKVDLEGASLDLFSGDFSCRRFTVMNQSIFTRRPHIELRGIRGTVDLREIRNHHVWIPLLNLDRLDYLMERVKLPDGDTRTNSRMMVWSIKDFKTAHEKNNAGKDSGGLPWKIEINRIAVSRGSFTFDQIIPDERHKLFFGEIKGYLDGFQYPTPDDVMSHYAHLEGLFGTMHPVPFVIEGPGNYATSNVSFRLHGKINEGPIEEFEYYWRSLPVRVLAGNFELEVQAGYRNDYLDSQSKLILKSLKLTSGEKVSDKIPGTTLVAMLKFMENRKATELSIPVHGDITDPTFEVSRAFRDAFQEALKQFAFKGVGQIKEGTTKLATGTTTLAVKTTEKILGGVGAVTEAVVTKTPVVSEILVPKSASQEDQEEDDGQI